MSLKTVAIIQARMGSTRLPGKVMMKLGGRSLLAYLVNRLNAADSVDQIVVATTTRSEDEIVVQEAESLGVAHYRGSESDVLGRYLEAAKEFGADIIVRVTADNPFTDPASIDRVVARIKSGYEYAIETDLPVGTTGEAMTFQALEFLDAASTTVRWREHVTLYAKEHPQMLRTSFVTAPSDCARPDLSYTVDYLEEYEELRELCAQLPDPKFPLKELIALADKQAVVWTK